MAGAALVVWAAESLRPFVPPAPLRLDVVTEADQLVGRATLSARR